MSAKTLHNLGMEEFMGLVFESNILSFDTFENIVQETLAVNCDQPEIPFNVAKRVIGGRKRTSPLNSFNMTGLHAQRLDERKKMISKIPAKLTKECSHLIKEIVQGFWDAPLRDKRRRVEEIL